MRHKVLVLAVVSVGVLALAFLWGLLEPQGAPPWLASLTQRVLEGDPVETVAEPIRIAVAVDGPGDRGPGQSVVNGVQLFVDAFNEAGGLEGTQVEIDVYDDAGEVEQAQRIAHDIARSEAVAVIGHRLTATSMAAGPIYRDEGISAITPTATHPDITNENTWFFRTIYDDDHLGRFIAHYTDAVIAPDRTLVVAGDHAYGLTLAQVFTETYRELGQSVEDQITLDEEASETQALGEIDELLERVSRSGGESAVFFAAYPEEAVDVIAAIRDAGLENVALVAPDSFDRADLPALFDAFPNARRSPGFYTDGIDVATPLLFDTADRDAGLFYQEYQARFARAPDWRAAYAYDAAHAIAEALGHLDDWADRDLASTRRGLRDQLARMNAVDTGFEGITGPIFFDPSDRDVPRPAAIGRYHGRLLVSELTQFKTIRTLGFNKSLRQLIEDRQVIDIDGQLMRRVAIVYTGGRVREVEIDADAMTFDLVGRLWFRSSEEELEPSNIEILNAVGDVEMTELDRLTTADGLHYERYRIAGTFRLDPVPELRKFREPLLGVTYRHRRLSSQELLFVVDLQGLGATAGTPPEQASTLLAKAIEGQGWQMGSTRVAYQTTAWVHTEGVPAFIDQPENAVPFSTFVIAARVAPVGGILESALWRDLGTRAALGSAMIVLITIAVGAFASRGPIGVANLLVQFLALSVLIHAGEAVLFEMIETTVPFQHLEAIAKLFEAAWWLIPAIYLVILLNRFVWPFVEARTGRAVPQMIRVLSAIVILLLALFAVIGLVYEQPITSLLATSGLIGLVVGLAVQANIANVFAGIVLSAERPFGLGDVIETEGHGVARVTDMTWRTTRMVTPTNLEISVPNGAIAEGFIKNHSKGLVKTVVDIWLPPSLPLDWVTEKILEGIGRSTRVMREPAFGVEYGGVQVQRNQWAMNYQAYFFVEDGIESGAICSDVSRSVWEVLGEAGVTKTLGSAKPQ